jgi:hypothetical protein
LSMVMNTISLLGSNRLYLAARPNTCRHTAQQQPNPQLPHNHAFGTLSAASHVDETLGTESELGSPAKHLQPHSAAAMATLTVGWQLLQDDVSQHCQLPATPDAYQLQLQHEQRRFKQCTAITPAP